MPRSRKPAHAERITEYDQLRFYARMFGQGSYNCLIFVGPPGRLKSSVIEAETKGAAHLISGHATPFEVFCESQGTQGPVAHHRRRRRPLPGGHRATPAQEPDEPEKPQGRVLDLRRPDDPWAVQGLQHDLENLHHRQRLERSERAYRARPEDRSRLFLFDPPPAEVHREMERQEWFHDEEVYGFIGQNLCFFTDLSARAYVKAAEAKEAGEDWRAYLLKKAVEPHHLALLS